MGATWTGLRGDGSWGAEVLEGPLEAVAEDTALREPAEGANAAKGESTPKRETPEDTLTREAAGRANSAKGETPVDAPREPAGGEKSGRGEGFDLGKAAVLEVLPDLDFAEGAEPSGADMVWKGEGVPEKCPRIGRRAGCAGIRDRRASWVDDELKGGSGGGDCLMQGSEQVVALERNGASIVT